jgi:O-antigen/teichoic acid export membrane protein
MTVGERAARRGGMVRNFMHLGMGQVATTILTIALNYTLAHALSTPDFGLMVLLTSTAGFVYVVVDWGHGPAIIRESARQPGRSGELLGSATALRIAFALLACPVTIASSWLLGYDIQTCLLSGLLVVAWLPQYLGLSFGWVFRAWERMDSDALLNVVLKLATLAGSIACLKLGGHLLGLVMTWSLAGVLTLAVAIVMYRRLQLPPLGVNMATSRELLRDGTPIFVMTLAGAFEPFFNTNVLFKMASPEVAGWYGAAWVIAGTLLAPASVLGAAMYPRLSAAAGNNAEFKRAFDLSFRPLLLLAVLGSVGTWLFARVPVELIYSVPKFAPSIEVLRAGAPVLLLMYIDIMLGMAIMAAGKSRQLAFAKIAAVFFTTVLVYVLVPWSQARFGNGGLGAMYALGVGELLMLAAAVTLLREVIDRRTIREFLLCMIAGAATLLLFHWLPDFSPFLAIPLCVLAFGAFALLTGAVKRADVAHLRESLRRRMPRAP